MGRRESNDFLLPAMITLLNDRGAWQLRAAFFQHIAQVAAHAGPAGLEAFLLPILEQVRRQGLGISSRAEFPLLVFGMVAARVVRA